MHSPTYPFRTAPWGDMLRCGDRACCETKPHTVPEKTGTGRQSGGRRPGLGLKSRPTGWDWLGLKIIRPTCCIASKLITVQGARDWRALRSWQSAGNPASGPDWPRDWHLDGRAFAVRIKQYQAKEHRRSYTGPRHASGQSVPKCSRASHPASHEQSTRRRRTHAV